MNLNDIFIKETTNEDFNDIMAVEKAAFTYDTVADLTADLLSDKTAEPMVSLLAYHDGKAVGHILFTRAYFKYNPQQPMMHILAPLAVIPEYQGKGIGKLLIAKGIELIRSMGSHLVFVLGHKNYYPRAGFTPDAEALGYPAPYPILERFKDCWMAMPISPEGYGIGKGTIGCSEAFDKPEHWRDDEEDR